MTGQFKYLFTPLTVGNVTIRNRILTTGTVTCMADHGMPTEQHAYYYAERAKGGIGLIVMGFPSVHRTSQHVINEVSGFDDRIIPGLRLISDRVHEHGAKIFAQLGHAGRQGNSVQSEIPLWSSSSIPCPTNREMPKAIEIEEIKEMVGAHASAARRMRDGGLDGVEIHSGYGGYLLSQFISPYANKRTDEYGGSLDNRLRIVEEVTEAVRAAVGQGFVVGLQINADDLSPGGLGLEQYQEVVKRLERTGKLDYLVVKASTYYCVNMNIPDMQHPLGLWVPFAAGIREVVKKLPVVAVARINDPILAEKILADGHADMVAMARQHICDPETANKAKQGRLDDIRQCVACNEGCVDMVLKGHHLTCIQNPAVGKEKELGIGSVGPAGRKKKVVVAGGGPGGMKAAEVAARRGHRVVLFERREQLGGQVRIASLASSRDEIGGVTRWLEGQIAKLGVDVRLGVNATAATVLAEQPEAVVVATGSVPVRSPIGYMSYGVNDVPGFDQPNVLSVWDVLEDGVDVGQRVVVVDDGEGQWKAVSVAETLADKAKYVEIISPLAFIGASIGVLSLPVLFPRLFEKGIKLTPFAMVTRVSGHSVMIVEQGKKCRIEAVDTVVLAGWHKPDESLYFALKGKVNELYRVGDCVASRRILEAIREGDQVGRRL